MREGSRHAFSATSLANFFDRADAQIIVYSFMMIERARQEIDVYASPCKPLVQEIGWTPSRIEVKNGVSVF